MINTGAMRDIITIQKTTYTVTEANGERRETWVDVGDYWAQIKPLTGREYMAAAQMQADYDTLLLMRYTSIIDVTMRALAGHGIYEFKSVIDVDNRRNTLQIRARMKTT
jgi:SPP1 family predicted phage head-tail adaptor